METSQFADFSIFLLLVLFQDQVSHPYKTTEKSLILFTLIFMFIDDRHKILIEIVASIPRMKSSLYY
jgi:hypothetical protein